MVAIAEYMVGGVWGFIIALFRGGLGCLEVLCFRYHRFVLNFQSGIIRCCCGCVFVSWA